MLLINKILEFFKSFKYSFDNLKTNNNFYFLDDPHFLRTYENAKIILDFQPDIPLRVHQAIWCAYYAKNINGDIIELGTGKGFLFYNIMCHYGHLLKRKNIYLCDTFLSFKTDMLTGKQVPENGISKIYAQSYDQVKNSFAKWENIQLVKGLLPNSLIESNIKIEAISFLHVDLNFYKAEIECLEYLWEKICLGGIILLDDFGNPGREAQMEAHLNFFTSKGQVILSLATGQGLVIKAKSVK
jgi:hypothetical protein